MVRLSWITFSFKLKWNHILLLLLLQPGINRIRMRINHIQYYTPTEYTHCYFDWTCCTPTHFPIFSISSLKWKEYFPLMVFTFSHCLGPYRKKRKVPDDVYGLWLQWMINGYIEWMKQQPLTWYFTSIIHSNCGTHGHLTTINTWQYESLFSLSYSTILHFYFFSLLFSFKHHKT